LLITEAIEKQIVFYASILQADCGLDRQTGPEGSSQTGFQNTTGELKTPKVPLKPAPFIKLWTQGDVFIKKISTV
jgi:hypothetical protein